MKRILLTTVAVLPLLAAGVLPASSQDVKKPGMSQSQGQAPAAGTQEKRGSQGAAKSLTQGSQEKTQGSAQSAPSGNDKNAQSGGENKSVGQANERGKSAVSEGQSKGRQATGNDNRGAQNQNQKGAQNQNQKSSRNPTQTTGQSNRNQQGQSQQQPSTTGQSKQQPNTTGQNQRENTNQNVQQNQPAQQNQQGANQQGNRTETQGSVTLNEQQRTRIQQTVLSGRNVPREERVDFSINVGTTVPTRVRVVAVPRELIEIHPEWRSDEYFVVRDDIIIVDRSHRIVAMVPVGSSSSSVETRGSSTTVSFESPEQIREIQQVLIEKGFFHGRVDGIMGRETVAAVIEFQRKEGIEATGHIDERTVTALGVSGHTEGQGGRQGVEGGQNQPGQNNAGQNQPGKNNAGQSPGQKSSPSTSGQGGKENQPSANPGKAQNNPGQTNGQGGSQNPPSAKPNMPSNQPSTSGQGASQPSANPSGGNTNGQAPKQKQQDK